MKLPYSKAIFLSVIDVLTSIIPVPDTFLVIAETCSFVRWTIGSVVNVVPKQDNSATANVTTIRYSLHIPFKLY